MLWTIFVVMIALWLYAVIASITLYGYIHLLLVVAVAALFIQITENQRFVR